MRRALPPAQPTQRPVDTQPLDQRGRRRQPENRFRDKRPRQPMPILEGTPWQPMPHTHERLDARNFQNDRQPLVLRRERPRLSPQRLEKKTLNVILNSASRKRQFPVGPEESGR
jgi:hypothetical protein